MGERNDLIDSVIDASADQRDQWFAERGVTTDRAKWKARALAAEATIASLSEALAEAEKKGAEALRHIQEHFPGAAAEFEAVYERTAPPRDLSQGGQHG